MCGSRDTTKVTRFRIGVWWISCESSVRELLLLSVYSPVEFGTVTCSLPMCVHKSYKRQRTHAMTLSETRLVPCVCEMVCLIASLVNLRHVPRANAKVIPKQTSRAHHVDVLFNVHVTCGGASRRSPNTKRRHRRTWHVPPPLQSASVERDWVRFWRCWQHAYCQQWCGVSVT